MAKCRSISIEPRTHSFLLTAATYTIVHTQHPSLKIEKKSGQISIPGAIVSEKIMLDPCMYHISCPKGGKNFWTKKVVKGLLQHFNKYIQDEEPYEEANIDDLFTSIYDIDLQLGSTLPSRYPRYLNDRAAAFVEDLEIIENNYK